MTTSGPSVQTAAGTRAAVASGHALASAEALRVLATGGNIIDAAIGGAMVLAVVLPYACGIGGDMYMLFHDARTGKTHGLNGTGAAPARAHAGQFPGGMPQTGVRAATVPGVVMAWHDALSHFGTRGMAELLQPAIRLARDGFPAHDGSIQNAVEKKRLLLKNVEATRLYLPGGNPHPLGTPIVQSELAQSLSMIAEGGIQAFYRGELAQRWVDGTDALGGLFTVDDLRRHRTLWQRPISVPFYGHDVYTMPPNSPGVGLLLQLLALEAHRIHATDPRDAGLLIETLRAWRWARSIADEVVGDPRDAEASARRVLADIAAQPSGIVLGPDTDTASPPSGDTSNLVIMDAQGNAVSLVQSVSAPFASGVVLPGTGILLNNRMRGFNAKVGSINCVAPGRRPAHTLVPAMVRRHGEVVMAIGTPGAAGQTITLAQVLARILSCRQEVAEAIAAPRWSVAPSGKIILEDNTADAIVTALRRHEPTLELAPMSHVRFGSVKAVWKHDDVISAAADYRRVAAASAR
jgi:gamma-glutamyltranspeptidase